MTEEKQSKKTKEPVVIIEASDETIDFVDFVEQVLDYPMNKLTVLACQILLERASEPKGSSKQRGVGK